MWSYAVLLVVTAATGIYLTSNNQFTMATEQGAADALASSMATYRTAVREYFSLNPSQYQSVSISALKSSGALPDWSKLYAEAETSPWANYRDNTGLIYIYASSLPSTNITAEVARLSQNSILAGVYRTGDTVLYSPVFGRTQIPLPSPAVVSIPDGSPLWIVFPK